MKSAGRGEFHCVLSLLHILLFRDEKQKELKKLQATSKEDMWLADLDEFVAKLDEVEGKENKEVSSRFFLRVNIMKLYF